MDIYMYVCVDTCTPIYVHMLKYIYIYVEVVFCLYEYIHIHMYL